VAESPVIPGCISQGKTREEALANIREGPCYAWTPWRRRAGRFPRNTPLSRWNCPP